MSLPKYEEPDKNASPSSAEVDPTPSQCAILTGIGRSAVAVIGIRGPRAGDAVMKGFVPRTVAPFAAGQIRFGDWRGESVVVTPIDHEALEIHCHGGPSAASRIVDDLRSYGVEPVPQSRWRDTEAPLLIREAIQVLARCLTGRTAAIALDQVRGAMQRWCQQWIDELATRKDHATIQDLREQIRLVAGRGAFGIRITEPFRVVLVGPPNVGKSSLINAILGYDRSITMDVAGTTRDVLHADTVIDGLPIRLSDTAGMRSDADEIEKRGMELARRAIAEADLTVIVTDPDHPAGIDISPANSVRVFNKADQSDAATSVAADAISTVAIRDEGVSELTTAIAEKIARDLPEIGAPVPLTSRQVDHVCRAAEAESLSEIREHLRRLIEG